MRKKRSNDGRSNNVIGNTIISPTFLFSILSSLYLLTNCLYSCSPLKRAGWFSYVSSPSPNPKDSCKIVDCLVVFGATGENAATVLTRTTKQIASFMIDRVLRRNWEGWNEEAPLRAVVSPLTTHFVVSCNVSNPELEVYQLFDLKLLHEWIHPPGKSSTKHNRIIDHSAIGGYWWYRC